MFPKFENLVIYPGQIIKIVLGDKEALVRVKSVQRWKIKDISIDLSAGENEGKNITYNNKDVFRVTKEDGVIRFIIAGFEPSYIKMVPKLNDNSLSRFEEIGSGGISKAFGWIWSGESPRGSPKNLIIVVPGYYWTFDMQTPVATSLYIDLDVAEFRYEEVHVEGVTPDMTVQMAPVYIAPIDKTLDSLKG